MVDQAGCNTVYHHHHHHHPQPSPYTCPSPALDNSQKTYSLSPISVRSCHKCQGPVFGSYMDKSVLLRLFTKSYSGVTREVSSATGDVLVNNE